MLSESELKACKARAERLKFETQPEFIPEGLKLYDYQMEALRWLNFSWSQSRSVLLADEMGLGKTIQAIALVKNIIHQTGQAGPFVVICPLSTCENWKREFQLWAPELYSY